MKYVKTNPARLARALLCIACLAALLLCGCARNADPGNLQILNESSEAAIRSVSVAHGLGTEVAQRSDNEPLATGESFGFALPETDGCAVTVLIFSGVGTALEAEAPLAEASFTLALGEGKTATLCIRDGENGLVIEEAE